MKRSELIKEIAQGNPDDYVIAAIWYIEDLCPALAEHSIAIEGYENYRQESKDSTAYTTITKKEADEILNLISQKHDAGIGINWEDIQYWVDYWADYCLGDYSSKKKGSNNSHDVEFKSNT